MNTIVIGGGQAGITLSYYLQQRGVEHLVLERDRAFSAWHNCWDSFRMNTANWMNTLPGMQPNPLYQTQPKNCRNQPSNYTHRPIEIPTRSQPQMSSSSAAAAVGFKSAWTWHNRINLKTSHLPSAATASSPGLFWAPPSAYSRACSQFLKSSNNRESDGVLHTNGRGAILRWHHRRDGFQNTTAYSGSVA